MGAYDNLDPSFSSSLVAFINASGGKVRPGSGYRSYEEQAQLYADWKNGVPGQARAARPGHSQHNFGMAMDLQFGPGGREWAHENAARFGLYFPMSDEPWHIQLAGTPAGVAGGGGGTDKNALKGMMAAGIDPQDELASRMHQIMQVLGGANSAAGLFGDDGQEIQGDPFHQQYISQMFSGGAHLGSFPNTIITDMDEDGTAKDRYRKYAMKVMAQRYGWGPEEFAALDALWGTKESGWNPRADNPNSTAAGIAQKLQSAHGPVESTGEGQIDWGLQYIAGRYGRPSRALSFHEQNNWY